MVISFLFFSFSARFRHIDMRLYAYTYLQLCMVAIWILCENQLVLFVLHPISELTCIIYLWIVSFLASSDKFDQIHQQRRFEIVMLICIYPFVLLFSLHDYLGGYLGVRHLHLRFWFDWDREEWIVCISSGLDPDGWYQCQYQYGFPCTDSDSWIDCIIMITVFLLLVTIAMEHLVSKFTVPMLGTLYDQLTLTKVPISVPPYTHMWTDPGKAGSRNHSRAAGNWCFFFFFWKREKYVVPRNQRSGHPSLLIKR